MGFFSRIGQKFKSGLRLGQKFLKGVGSVGQKVASGVESAYNVASGFPIIGHALKSSPLVQGLRGVVSGVGAVAKVAAGADDIIEKGKSAYSSGDTSGLQKAAHQGWGQAKKLGNVGKNLAGEGSHLFNSGGKNTNTGHIHHQ